MKIKHILFTLFIFTLILSLFSCTPSNDAQDTDNTGNTPFTPDIVAIRDAMINKFGAEDAIPFESDLLLDLYGISDQDVEKSGCYMTLDGVFPQEIIMIKATDKDAAGRIITALEKRLSEVKIQSESYDPENYALAQKCNVQSRDLYVTLFLSPHFNTMTEMFYNAK